MHVCVDGGSAYRSHHVTKRDIRASSSGNIPIREIVNRARFDASFKTSRYTALVEEPTGSPLCYHYTWEAGVCKFGRQCRYTHDPDMILNSLPDTFPCSRAPLMPLSRVPLNEFVKAGGSDKRAHHSIAYIEYSGTVVWFRDGGAASRQLWHTCQSLIGNHTPAPVDVVMKSSGEVPKEVALLGILHEVHFGVLCEFLNISDIHNMLLSLSGPNSVRTGKPTSLLSPPVWDSVISKKWRLPYTPNPNPIQSFLDLHQSTIESHATLASSTTGLFTTAHPDLTPCIGIPALMELDTSASSGKCVLGSDTGSPVVDIRFTTSLIAIATGDEVSIYRNGDLAKLGTARQRMACDKVTLPATRDGSFLVHAGPAGIFIRDMYEPTLPVVRKVTPSFHVDESPRYMSLDAANHSVFAGVAGYGLTRFSTETGQPVSTIISPSVVTSRMWSEDGRLHLFLTRDGGSGSLLRWDCRVKQAMNLGLVDHPVSLSVKEWSGQSVVVGCDAHAERLDLRRVEAGAVWTIDSDFSPVRAVTYTERTVTLYQGSAQAATTTVSVFNHSHCENRPLLIGTHHLPYRVSAVGHASAGPASASGCLFGISRPKRSGRGDSTYLCVGGAAFIGGSR